MSDQTIAALIGALTIIALKVIEYLLMWWFPKGRIPRWTKEHTLPSDEDEKG